MNPLVRSAALGVAAAVVALAVCAALMLFYVEWLWFSEDANGHRTLTNLLLIACAVVVVASAFAIARIFEAQLLITLLVTVVLLAVPAYVGLRVLSHNNACWAGDSYPIGEEWELWGRECGR